MAIYRAESGRRVAVIAAVAAVAGLILGIVVGRVTAPGLGAGLDELRTQVAPIRSSLEVVRTEYPKLLTGGADPGGTASAMDRLDAIYLAVQPSLARIDTAKSLALGADLHALRAAIVAREPETAIGVAVDKAKASLDQLVGANPPGGTP